MVLHAVLRNSARGAEQAVRRDSHGRRRGGVLLPALARSLEGEVDPLSRLDLQGFLVAFAISFIALGYLGLQPATPAYTNAARVFGVIYFAFFILMPWYTKIDQTKPVPERVTYHAH